MTAAVNGSTTATISYDYDGLGRRIAKTVSGVSTTYLLDGDEEIAEYSGATVLRHFVSGPGVDDRIAHAEGSTIANPTKTYYHTNHQGSVMAMTDGSGNLTQRIGYDEYGNGSPATGEQFGYTGRRYDPDTGLYYYRARYYAPAIGRFLQVDPVGYKDNLNLYTYVGNDPLDKADPSGEICIFGIGDCSSPPPRPNQQPEIVVTAKKPNPVIVAGAAAGVATSEIGIGEVILLGIGIYAAIEGPKVASGNAGQTSDAPAAGPPDPNDDDKSQHAKDRKAERNVSQERIDEAKRIGREKPGNSPNEVVKEVPSNQSASGRGIRIVIDRASGRIVTVIDKGSRFK
jgi:RHS repeat-associated protein